MPKISILWRNGFLCDNDFLDSSTSTHAFCLHGDSYVKTRMPISFISKLKDRRRTVPKSHNLVY